MEKSAKLLKPNAKDGSLAKFRLFAELAEGELSALVDHSALSIHPDGECIITQGGAGHCMYVILEGGARVVADGVEIAHLREGDFFGEVALVDDGPRSADVFTVGETTLLVVTRMTLGVLAGVQPAAAIHLLAAIGKSLVAKLRADNKRFRDLILLGHRPA